MEGFFLLPEQPYLNRSLMICLPLLLGDLVFLTVFERRRHFPARLVLAGVLTMWLSALLFSVATGVLLNNVGTFVFTFLCTVLAARFCFRISWTDAVFCATAGYSIQFIQSILEEALQRVALLPRSGDPNMRQYAIMLAVYAAVWFTLRRQLKDSGSLELGHLPQLALTVLGALTEIVLCGLLRPYWNTWDDRFPIACTMLLLLLCAVSVLLFQFSLLRQKSLSMELEMVRQLQRREEQQYRISRETIDLVNQKCHDMRHQIRQIGRSMRMDSEAIRQMTDAIAVYDTMYHTGSRALDVILTEKTAVCRESGIFIRCIADGAQLSFLTETDIYSLFGNLLENAEHAVSELPEDQREIGLTVARHGEMLSVTVRNRYAGEIRMRGGFPVTGTGDTLNHGIGTRSIDAIVRRYGGTVSFRPDNGEFTVSILFFLSSLPDSEKQPSPEEKG